MRHVRMLGLSLVAAFATIAVVAGSAMAFTISQNLEQYKNCPLKDTLVLECTYGVAEGGHFTVGPINVPITHGIAFQGGFFLIPEEKYQFVLPPNGEAVVRTAETVPGEPFADVTPAEQKEFGWPAALQKSYENARIKGMFGEGTTTEVIEDAGVPEVSLRNFVFEHGVAITAPIKIIGKNKWLEKLGGNCKIGSTTDPIVQHLSSGTSTSPLTGETITGTAGELQIEGEGRVLGLVGARLVDNTFAVPAAEGCGGNDEAYIDPVMDRVFGLPAAAGASVTELLGFFDTAEAEFLRQEHIK